MASVYSGTGIVQRALKSAQEEERRQAAALAQMTQAQKTQYKKDRTLQPYTVSDSSTKKKTAKTADTYASAAGSYAPTAAYNAPANTKAAAYTPGESVMKARDYLEGIRGTKPGDYAESEGVLRARESLEGIRGTKPGEYTESENVLKAREYLEGIRGTKPGDYESRYADRLEGLLSQITGRGPFQYDAYTDPLYNIYKDIYIQNGRRAMQDTMGQAAALTGGYGNSYAQTAGQQQYNQYMEGLNQMVPELQQRAFEQWKEEGNELQRQYDMLNAEENRDYGRYRDRYGDWQTDLQLAQNEYNNEYTRDYGQYRDKMADWQNALQLARNEYNDEYNRDYGQYRDRYGDWQTELQLAQNEYGNEYSRDYGAYNDQRNYDMAVDQFNQQMALQYAQLALQQAQFDFQKSQASKKSSGGSGKSSGKSSAAQTAATQASAAQSAAQQGAAQTETAEAIQKNASNFASGLYTPNEWNRRGSNGTAGYKNYGDYVERNVEQAYKKGQLSDLEALAVLDKYAQYLK